MKRGRRSITRQRIDTSPRPAGAQGAQASPGVEHEFADALAQGIVKGRGAQLNPGNRYEKVRVHVAGEHLDEVQQQRAENAAEETDHKVKVVLPQWEVSRATLPQVKTRVLADQTRSLINPVDSPDIPFQWTINPYRGCEHGCVYCYARPDHERLGLSSGLDFETVIIAKHDAPELLRKELASAKWKGDTIVMSGVTDPYQPIEHELRITRRLLEIMAECRQAVSLVTKNCMVLRDLDLLGELQRSGAVHVSVSMTTLDHQLSAIMEPRASSPQHRLETIRKLSSAGIPVTCMVAPIIPALNSDEVPALLEAVAQAGATTAHPILLRLPHQLKALFVDWLARHFPDRARHVESLIRQSRGGELYDARFGHRHQGLGAWAQQMQQMFQVFTRRYGLDKPQTPLNTQAFRRPLRGGQMSLFERG